MHAPRIHKEGRNIIIFLTLLIFIINVVVYFFAPQQWIFAVTLVIAALLLCFVTYFFRNPVRILKVEDPHFLIAPADGRVVVIEETNENEYFHDRRLQISIFMSPFNVHANWYPIEGSIIRSEHQKGRHKGAWLPKSSTENERTLIVIKTAEGEEVAIRQIAGAMARRIVTYGKAGDVAKRNTHLGFIKLGSRVDMYLPLSTEVFVEIGDRVRGNEDIIARLVAPQCKPQLATNTDDAQSDSNY
ncbi:MAG: phosphatidylserine decarboxylase family protein [Paludibacteraceae bacterium]|nr:phosphatidylserine decarboxylase family protein [Paludibacteraceae bacterium]